MIIETVVKPSLAQARRCSSAPASPSMARRSLNCEDSLDLRFPLTQRCHHDVGGLSRPGEIKFSPLEFLGRLAALVPRPWLNLVRYHGIVAPNARWRKAIVPCPEDDLPDVPPSADSVDSSWASLLKRVFDIDVLTCTHCGGPLRIIVVITDPRVIRKILDHLGLPARAPPRAPSRVSIQM